MFVPSGLEPWCGGSGAGKDDEIAFPISLVDPLKAAKAAAAVTIG